MSSPRISLILTMIAFTGVCVAPAGVSHAYDPMVFSRVREMIVEARALSYESSEANEPATARGKRQQAEERYEQASEMLRDVQQELKEHLSMIGKRVLPAGDPRIQQRDQLRADYLNARLQEATIVEETADLYEGVLRIKRLEEAEESYLHVYENYRTRLAGLNARFYQGRCLAKLKKYEQADEALTSLLDLPNNVKGLQGLKVRAYPLAAEVWCDASQKKYAQAINYGESFLETATAEELVDDDFVNARLHLARAHKLQGDEFVSKNNAGAAASYRNAKRHAEFVAGREGEYRAAARELLAELEKALN